MRNVIWASHLLFISVLLLSQNLFRVHASEADSEFKKIYTGEWNWRKAQSSVDEDSAGQSIPDSLPDVSEESQQAHLTYWENVLASLAKLDVDNLSEQNKTNLAVYQQQLNSLISDIKFKSYEKPLSGDTSFWGDLSYLTNQTFHSEQDYRNYLQWLSDMPRYFDQQITNMRAGLERGFTLPKISLQGRDATVLAVVENTGQSNVFYKPFKHFPATFPASLKKELSAAGLQNIKRYVIPAHKRVLNFLQKKYMPGAVTSIAAYDLPNGPAFYQAQIEKFTTLTLSAEEIHQIGVAEVSKILARMLAIKEQLDFNGDLSAFLHFLRSDPQFYAKTPQALLDRAAWTAKEFDGKVGDWFGRLPRQRFAIKPVPSDVAPFYTSGRGGPGIYLVNTYDLASRPLYSLTALTLHESAPGHAFQMPLAAENTALPEFRRNTYISAYGEGWALYAESLGEEMDMYHSPYELFGMLSYQMWRAVRLVVDTGIHAKGWSRQQAQQFMQDNTALSMHEITTEVDRYIAWPGQALSYYLGKMAIEKSRKKAEDALGEKFDIRAFHDAVLQLGSVPLSVLTSRVDQFIAQGGVSPYKQE